MQAPPLVVPGAGLMRLIWLLNGTTQAMNVLGLGSGSGTYDQSSANALDTAIKASFSATIAASMHPTTTLQAVGIRSIGAPNQAEFVGSGAAVPATGTGDRLPPSVSFVVTLRTALAGSRNRGRCFLPGFTEAVNDPDGSAATTVATNAVAFVQAIRDALSARGMQLAVISRPAYATTRTITSTVPGGEGETETKTTAARPGAFNPVIALQARNDVWDSQRRRAAPGRASTLFRQPIASWHVDND